MQKQWTSGCNEFIRSTNFVRNKELCIGLHCEVFVLHTVISILSFLFFFFTICFYLSLHVVNKMPVVWQARPKRKYRSSALYGSVLETGETVGRTMRPSPSGRRDHIF